MKGLLQCRRTAREEMYPVGGSVVLIWPPLVNGIFFFLSLNLLFINSITAPADGWCTRR